MDAELIDQIYESAFVPELWTGVLRKLNRIAGARSGTFYFSKGNAHKCICSDEITYQVVQPLVESGWSAQSQRVRDFYAAWNGGFLREIDVWTRDELQKRLREDPTYRDFLVPYGLGMASATAFELPTMDRVWIGLERNLSLGPVEDDAIKALDALRPHLARSAFMVVRLQLQQAHAAIETLASLGLPGFAVDETGKVICANSLVETLPAYIHWRARDKISLSDHAAERLFSDALATIALDSASVRSFPIRNGATGEAMIAHVVPIRLSARDIFSRSAAVVLFMPVGIRDAPPVELVQSLFDLTPAEARVARDLASGKTVEDIASCGGLSSNTVRTHVRRILEKTGCSRQTDVVSLLTSIGPPGA